MTRAGKFGMLTNYRQAADHNLTTTMSDLKPRGHIVTNYLKGCHEPVKYINNLISGQDRYSKFNVLLGNYDKEAGFDVFYGSNALQQQIEDYKLKPGLSSNMFSIPRKQVKMFIILVKIMIFLVSFKAIQAEC